MKNDYDIVSKGTFWKGVPEELRTNALILNVLGNLVLYENENGKRKLCSKKEFVINFDYSHYIPTHQEMG
jgi:hypothetical protein